MSRVAVYPGTFDPLTLGHQDIIARAARLCDRLVVGVARNTAKAPLFTLDERLALIGAVVGPDVTAVPFDGLAVDFARVEGATLLVRGLRTSGDFDYEQPMAAMNRTMAPTIETLFLAADAALQPISSTLVREIARAGGDVTPFVSPVVAEALRGRAEQARGRA